MEKDDCHKHFKVNPVDLDKIDDISSKSGSSFGSEDLSDADKNSNAGDDGDAVND